MEEPLKGCKNAFNLKSIKKLENVNISPSEDEIIENFIEYMIRKKVLNNY